MSTGFTLLLAGLLDEIWIQLLPFLAEPESFVLDTLMTEEMLSQLKHAWNLFWWFTVMGIFNAFLGEKFPYQGGSLSNMKGVFGKWDMPEYLTR